MAPPAPSAEGSSRNSAGTRPWRKARCVRQSHLRPPLRARRRPCLEQATIQRVCLSAEWVVRQAWRIEHPVEYSRGADLAMERRSADSRKVIRGAELVQHANDRVPAEIGGVTHRRAPVPALDQRVLV